MKNRFVGCLLGLACGDAVGTAVEFKPRGTFPPVTDMVGGGPFNLRAGEWTDDTSMALCLAVSLLEKDGFEPADQMERYCRWQDEGYLSSNGRCFDIGNTVAAALGQYRVTGEPFSGATAPFAAGNGSLMRLAPLAMYYAGEMGQVVHYAGESSRTTHGAREAVDGCRLLGKMIALALRGEAKEEVLFNAVDASLGIEELTPRIAEIALGHYRDKREDEIWGSGYVVASLEAALWSFLHTESYEEGILRAVNLGDDADTTAAVCGQIAGAYYGIEGIPPSWLAKLAKREYIEQLARMIYHKAMLASPLKRFYSISISTCYSEKKSGI
jgi:ADP-ribosyl-[dinitrogen reductase] hydrolase